MCLFFIILFRAATQHFLETFLQYSHRYDMDDRLLTLESHAWDLKRSQDRNRIRDGPVAIRRIVKKVDDALKTLSAKAPKLALSRKKRDFYYMRQKTVLDDFRTEKTGLDMLLCDGEASVLRYYENKANVFTFEIKFIQPSERSLNSHLHKHKMRLTGYPKTLVESLHDRENMDEGNELAASLWNLQRQMCAIVGGERYHQAQATSKPRSMLHMITVLQLGEIIFTRDAASVEDKDGRVLEFFDLCVGVIDDLYDWSPPEPPGGFSPVNLSPFPGKTRLTFNQPTLYIHIPTLLC
jgi:hypothetical protein